MTKTCFTCKNIGKCTGLMVRECKTYRIDEATQEPILIELNLWTPKEG